MNFFFQNRYVLDLLATVMFFTRIPVNWSHFSEKAPDLTRAAWAFPLIGYFIGILSGGLGDILLFLGLPIFVASVIAVALSVFITGAIHEDGLADMADGFGAGGNSERINEIIHDSRLGTYGVIALILGILIRVGLVVSLVDLGYSLIIVLSIGFASGKMAILISRNFFNLSDFAKTGSVFGSVTSANILIATIIWLTPLLFFFPIFAILLGVFFSFCLIYIIGSRATNLIGGITGDVLGATAFLSEIGFFLGVAIALFFAI